METNNEAFEELEQDQGLAELDAPKAPAKPAPTPINKRAEDWQSKTDALVEGSLLALPKKIFGVELFPFTVARGSLLRRIGNEFVRGVQLSSIEDPFLSIGKFLAIMSATLDDARKLAVDPDALEKIAYTIMDTMLIKNLTGMVDEINTYVSNESSNQVHGEQPEVEGSSAPPAPKN